MTASFSSYVKRISRFFDDLEKWLLVLLISFLAIFAILQIILRNFFSTGFVWGDDLLRHGVLWISFLGAARATLEKKHIRIDLLSRIVPARAVFVVHFICSLISLLICLALFWASWNFVQGERLAGGISFASIPYWCLELIFPISFGLMACRFAIDFGGGLGRGAEGIET